MIEGKRYYVLPISKITIRKDVIDTPRWWNIIIKTSYIYVYFWFLLVYFTVNRTSNDLSRHVSFEIQSYTSSHREPPPSYESLMSRSNEAFQSTASLHPSSSASNKESSEVINVDLPSSYASVTSQYNDDLQPSQSEVLSNDVKWQNPVYIIMNDIIVVSCETGTRYTYLKTLLVFQCFQIDGENGRQSYG